jgi:hypothetical protein
MCLLRFENNFSFYILCSLRFENNLLNIGSVRFALCSAQTRTGMGHLRKPPGVELIPAVD